jgi:hypothetical protein
MSDGSNIRSISLIRLSSQENLKGPVTEHQEIAGALQAFKFKWFYPVCGRHPGPPNVY